MSADILGVERILELIEDEEWLATDDGDELCPSCARENQEQLLEASREQWRNGWGVVGVCVGGEATCCTCNASADLDEG